MGTVPSPHAWIAGDDATSTYLQTLTDGILFALGSATSGSSRRPRVQARQTVGQSIPNSTITAVLFDIEDRDYETAGTHSTVTNTSRFTAATAGVYKFGGLLTYGTGTTGVRYGFWGLNGTAQPGTQAGASGITCSGFYTVNLPDWEVFLNVGDYVEMLAQQSSGAALSLAATGQFQALVTCKWDSN